MYCSARRHGPFKSRAAWGLLVEENNWIQMKGKIPGYYPGNCECVKQRPDPLTQCVVLALLLCFIWILDDQ